MHKLFVCRKYIGEDELLELNAFVQLLPGAGSSQILTLIAFKRGGVLLAFFTLIIWILPASFLMGALSFLLRYIDEIPNGMNIFRFIQPMAIGFLAYSAYKSFFLFVKHQATLFIMLGALLVSLFIKSPWVFPILILTGSIVSNFSDKRIPDRAEKTSPIRWANLWGFITIFVLAGILSEIARVNDWAMRKPINLFENFYRFGSLVFGGGGVLIPMMFEQYVTREKTRYITPQDFLTGAGMVQAFPGPVFSIAAFIGGMVLQNFGPGYQLMGCFIGTIAIFLPSFLLVIFFFPVWNKIKKQVVVFRAMEGINAVVVGIMIAATIILFTSLSKPFGFQNLLPVCITVAILLYDKIPSPIIVILFLICGWLF